MPTKQKKKGRTKFKRHQKGDGGNKHKKKKAKVRQVKKQGAGYGHQPQLSPPQAYKPQQQPIPPPALGQGDGEKYQQQPNNRQQHPALDQGDDYKHQQQKNDQQQYHQRWKDDGSNHDSSHTMELFDKAGKDDMNGVINGVMSGVMNERKRDMNGVMNGKKRWKIVSRKEILSDLDYYLKLTKAYKEQQLLEYITRIHPEEDKAEMLLIGHYVHSTLQYETQLKKLREQTKEIKDFKHKEADYWLNLAELQQQQADQQMEIESLRHRHKMKDMELQRMTEEIQQLQNDKSEAIGGNAGWESWVPDEVLQFILQTEDVNGNKCIEKYREELGRNNDQMAIYGADLPDLKSVDLYNWGIKSYKDRETVLMRIKKELQGDVEGQADQEEGGGSTFIH